MGSAEIENIESGLKKSSSPSIASDGLQREDLNETMEPKPNAISDTNTTGEAMEQNENSVRHWLIIAGAFFCVWNTLGLGLMFGVYEAFYLNHQLQGFSSSEISWISTCQTFILVFGGIFTGVLFDRGYLRELLIFGCIFESLGMFMTSISTQYYSIFLSQAVCIGIGASCVYTPGLAMISLTFTKRRQLALSIATTGASVGGIILPIVFEQLQPQIGFGWTVRVQAFIVFSTLAFALFAMSTIKPPKQPPRSLFDASALKHPPYMALCFQSLLMLMAFWIPYIYIPTYVIHVCRTTQSFAYNLLAITNAASMFGRLAPVVLVHFTTPSRILVVFEAVCIVLIFCWIPITELGSFIAFCILWGFFSGPLGVLPTAVAVELSPEPGRMGARIGMMWAFGAFGVLIGSPIAGAASDPNKNDFLGGQVFAGVIMALTTAMLGLSMWWRGREAKEGVWRWERRLRR